MPFDDFGSEAIILRQEPLADAIRRAQEPGQPHPVLVSLPAAMSLRLTNYAIAKKSNAPACLRHIIEMCEWSYTDDEIAAWRIFMLETESVATQVRNPMQYFINDKAEKLLQQLSKQLKLSTDDVAALIFADTCDDVLKRHGDKSSATVIPFPSK